MTTIDQTLDFIEHFKTTEYWAVMQRTVENSPWHREANVAVHTEMSMEVYIDTHAKDRSVDLFNRDRSEQEQKLALIALLFHDTGKPAAEEVVEKKDGTGDVYRRYAGHEQDSAVTFTECYVTMPELRALLTPLEARAVRWTIEHHLPYGLKDKTKRLGLRTGTRAVYDEIGLSDRTFFDCLRSDGLGRISDDHDAKTLAVNEWISEFQTIEPMSCVSREKPTMYILIGASGSGKTTWILNRTVDDKRPHVISHDSLKVSFFLANCTAQAVAGYMNGDAPKLYEDAWQYATIEHESEFKSYAHQYALQVMKEAQTAREPVYIDIVNANKKRRQQFVDMANRFDFKVVAVEFWNSFATLSARQKTRGDKRVPDSSIRQQLNATTCAWLGMEAEDVIMVVGS